MGTTPVVGEMFEIGKMDQNQNRATSFRFSSRGVSRLGIAKTVLEKSFISR